MIKYKDLKCEYCNGAGTKERNDDGADVEYDCFFCNGTGVDFDQLKQMNKENPNTMTTTKEELDEAIEYIESLKHWMNLPDPKNLNTALTILTKYRDGELVEKSERENVLKYAMENFTQMTDGLCYHPSDHDGDCPLDASDIIRLYEEGYKTPM